MVLNMDSDPKQHYPKEQMWLHWLSLALIAIAYAAIELKDFVPKSNVWHDYIKLIHFNAGLLAFAVMLLRVYLYKRNTEPQITPEPPLWQRKVSSITHKVIYLCFLSLPLLGLVLMYIGGKQWDFLGIQMPVSSAPDRALSKSIKEVHETLADAGYFLIALHAGAALFHHYFVKDDTLKRMLP